MAYLFIRDGIHVPFMPAQQALSDAMIGYWTAFAWHGDPNSAGLPAWAAYVIATDLRQSLVPPTPMVESGYADDHRCAYWDAL